MKHRYYVALFAVLTALYLALTILIAPTHAALAQYHITLLHARVIIYSVAFPLAAIWTAGLYGSLKMKGYADLVKNTPEGKPFNIISLGLMVLVFTQPLGSDISSIIGLVLRHEPTWIPTMTIINNYISLVLMGIGLVIMAIGAEKLSGLLKRTNGGHDQQIWVSLFIILSALYSYFLVNQPIHTTQSHRYYFMPDWTALLTIAIPYLYFWYRGFSAAYCIYVYQKKIKGKIYKNSLVYVAAGISLVIVSSVFVRFLTTISNSISRLSLTPVLFIIYAFLAITGVGYLLIAWGANKLRKIEEV